MRRLRNIAANIFSSTTLLFVFGILFAYFLGTGILTKNRIYIDSIVRLNVHNVLLKDAACDYVSSVLWMNYSVKTRENQIVSNEIVKSIHDKYGSDSTTLCNDLDKAILNGKSNITVLLNEIIDQYGDKIVLYRHGDRLYPLNDDSHDNLIFSLNKDSLKRFIRKDISHDILLNQSPTFQNFENFIYNIEPTNKVMDFDNLKKEFVDNNYDPAYLKGLMISAAYINWKRGLFGDNLTLTDGKPNPNIRQLVIISKINISEMIISNPLIVKHIANFPKNAAAVDETFENNNKYNLIIMVGNLIMLILVALTVMIQYDLTNIKKATKRRRRNDDISPTA